MQSSNRAVATCPAYITPEPTMLIVKQHSQGSERDFTCFHANSSVLFEIIGDGKSSSRRRKLVDPAKDTPLFELRRRYLNFEEQWCLEFPEDVSDQSHSPQFSVAMKWKGWSNFDITMDNMASSNVERVVLEVRARTVRHTTYDISLDGQKIIEARKISGKEAPGETARIRNNPAWELDVDAGVDTSLASIVAVMLTDLNPANIWTRSGHA
ncbi:hypothetical protein VTO58DRAFT_103585 [Aureobasidium pullulans]|nr:hypothetical protein JADG_006427 [Aureobasidium pullulans]